MNISNFKILSPTIQVNHMLEHYKIHFKSINFEFLINCLYHRIFQSNFKFLFTMIPVLDRAATGVGWWVRYADWNSASSKAFSLNGHINVTLNPDWKIFIVNKCHKICCTNADEMLDCHWFIWITQHPRLTSSIIWFERAKYTTIKQLYLMACLRMESKHMNAMSCSCLYYFFMVI